MTHTNPQIDPRLIAPIAIVAGKYEISANVVYGVCMAESGMDPLAARHEDNYRWLYHPSQVKPAGCSMTTEIVLQKTSMGLMQVMGAVFRELGYRGWLTEVFHDTGLQLEYGCRHLRAKFKRFGFFEGLLAYNSGSPRRNSAGEYVNFGYARRVAEYVRQAQETGLFPGSDDAGVTWINNAMEEPS